MPRPEVAFWQLLKEHIPGDKERIENLVSEGTPDVTAAFNGVDFWLELKVCHNTRKEVDPATLCRDSQLIWHTRRGRHGSLIFVAVRYRFAVILYQWVKYAVYEKVVLAKYSGNGYCWGILETALKAILYNRKGEF